MILRHCIKLSYMNNKPLIIICIDFSKAYDSIKRDELIKIMMEYKIDPRIIKLITKLYLEDKTHVTINEGSAQINITSGIRQGCTVSTTLFKLITYKIIQSLDLLAKGYKDYQFKINSLFYADDGMILCDSVDGAEESIEKLQEVGNRYGLQINTEKCTATIFNMEEKPDKIKEIQVKNNFKYLGLTINNNRQCFTEHKKMLINKATKLANMTYSTIAKSC